MIRFVICQLSFSYVLLMCNCRMSGLYIDNGIDQTLVQRFMTRQEKREVENEILNLLGLQNRPRPAANSKTLGSSAPKFLLDVYKSLLDSSVSRTTRSEFNLSGRDLHAIDESDVIMTFTSNNKHVSSVRHERGKRLWFDVSDIPVGETIVDAELRLYKNSNYSMDSGENFTVSVYQLLLENGEKELEFVDAVNTSYSQEGWLIFNMTGPLTSWVTFPQTNKGLYMSVHPADRLVHEMRPEDIGIVSTSLEGEEEKQPFMVAFLKATSNTPKRTRKTREIRRRKKAENSETSYSRNPFTDSSLWSTRSCQIQTLYVSFRDLGWQDWIIAPDGYGAFYCSGECNFPLNAHMNATNHAIVQTLVHLMYPFEVPKPYCAPTKLTPISVLYFLDDSNVILKKYKNMVVKSCGCH
ncbi:protein 60A [Homalodisca vitripennis]|nr:protein 60A [Homalodisca vitripennis]KAG8291315.1 Bone morphogenetic protein 5 [Homalodisca vitripennis]